MRAPVIVPVHNLGAGGNTPPFWLPPPRGVSWPHVMVNAYYLRPHHRKDVNLSDDVVAWVDSGGFLYIRDATRRLAVGKGRSVRLGEPLETPESISLVERVLRRQESFGADYAFTLDYPLHGASDGEVESRLRVTARNAALAYHLRRRRGMKLLVVLHYRSLGELKLLLRMLREELRRYTGMDVDDVDGFAVGGLVPYRANLAYIAERLLEARRELHEDTLLHVLGVASPVNIPLLYAYGGDSMDSKTFIIAAAKRLWYTPLEKYVSGRLPARLQARGSRLKPWEYCSCPICRRFDTLDEMSRNVPMLSLHNLWVTLEAANLARRDPPLLLERLAKLNARVARALTVHPPLRNRV